MRTFRRLLGFLRPYRRTLIGSLVLAWAAMGMTVLIPWLVGNTVDAIENGDRAQVLPLAAVILAAGLLRLALTASRRAGPRPALSWPGAPTNRRSRPALQEVQQRIAELTAEAEEGVSGIRIVKAFAREEHMLTRFRRSVGRVFDQNVYSTRLRAFYSPLLGFLPSLGLAIVLLVGGRQVISGGLTLGEFTAFYTYLIMLTGPMRMLGISLGMAQRAVASGNRLFEILDRRPRIESRAEAPPL